jgi:hypothetical protein
MKTHVFFLSLMLVGCGKQAAPELQQAKDVLESFVHPLKLQNSMFAAAYPESKPSQFVKYILSPAAASELPPGEAIARDEDREMAAAMGTPLWPRDVAMVAGTPDPARGKQVVLKSDDATRTLVLELYGDPSSDPDEVLEWSFPVITPTATAKMFYETNLESGLRFQ